MSQEIKEEMKDLIIFILFIAAIYLVYYWLGSSDFSPEIYEEWQIGTELY